LLLADTDRAGADRRLRRAGEVLPERDVAALVLTDRLAAPRERGSHVAGDAEAVRSDVVEREGPLLEDVARERALRKLPEALRQEVAALLLGVVVPDREAVREVRERAVVQRDAARDPL